ncbi:MAG: Rrf2 family transcriptional regulator, partial [Mucispirillum sp.]|nr:Rrf2 family transcriptional regulator [Mucispirillum sp.]
MKITTKSIYAIRALHTLNMLSKEGKPVGIATLSEKLGLSNKYLEQIFSSLKKSKFVISTAGKLGGYKLARHAEEISILDVITVMDGGLVPVHCVNNKDCTVCA